MIPKRIHYCWFGRGEKPKLAEKCITSWKKYCPDYEIFEWNEDNFDIESCPLYVKQAYAEKKWAFVTDYVRLKVVCEHGGIYMDTDVELIKSLDSLLNNKAYFGFENRKYVNTGIGFGAEKGNEILVDMMSEYEDISFVFPDGSYNLITCPYRNTKVLEKYGLKQNGKKQILETDVLILPSIYFCPISYRTGNMRKSQKTISIHWFSASWKRSTILVESLVERKEEHRKEQRLNSKNAFKHYIRTKWGNKGDIFIKCISNIKNIHKK